jgi:TnpA family transposase
MSASRLSVQYVTKPIDEEKPLSKSSSVPARFLRSKLVRQLSRLKDIDATTIKRRELLSAAQRVQLPALPTGLRELEERYSFTPSDLKFIDAHRTNSNRLGIAVHLCFLRHPGWAWTPEERIPVTMLWWIAA